MEKLKFPYQEVLPGAPGPVDFHLKGLEKLGAKITLKRVNIGQADRLIGNKVSFDFLLLVHRKYCYGGGFGKRERL
ncbi:MAG: hypothetical protein CM1200mP10_23550 [Candidatus Neomarinimicrobiota bacterium]|nr:MAG: hypothetical protein CM1200mP10_23550 [Candidatus Neomarinimicrobiota bacterium]